MADKIYLEAQAALSELIEKAGLSAGKTVIIGCSTSEVAGERIGSYSSPEIAASIFSGLYDIAAEKGINLAFQCCEHLNRAVVVSREAAPYSEIVNVIPQPKAGGSLGTVAYKTLPDAVVVEEIKADAGLDIGLTLIGMHLKRVAVPVRLEQNRIGDALVVAAKTRPKFIGGSRAVYSE